MPIAVSLYPMGLSYRDMVEIAKLAEASGYDAVFTVEAGVHSDALAGEIANGLKGSLATPMRFAQVAARVQRAAQVAGRDADAVVVSLNIPTFLSDNRRLHECCEMDAKMPNIQTAPKRARISSKQTPAV